MDLRFAKGDERQFVVAPQGVEAAGLLGQQGQSHALSPFGGGQHMDFGRHKTFLGVSRHRQRIKRLGNDLRAQT